MMQYFYRKIVRRLGLHRKYKTERVNGFLTTFEPATDIGGKLYIGELFEEDELNIASKYIKYNSTVLDIGANIGIHALKFSIMAKKGLVIACEPQPKTFRTLLKNIYQNNIINIIPLNVAIARSAEIAEFYIMSDDAYSSLIDTGRKALIDKIKVLCTSIDGLLGIIKVDFVKIDVEGLELSVLQSMNGLIQRCSPVIFCEIYKGSVDLYDPNDAISFLRNKGYGVYRVIDGALVEFSPEERHEDCYYNYFFLPESNQEGVRIYS